MDRSDWIIQHFDYLINEFDFFVEKKEFDPQLMGNAYVLFRTPNVGIEIVIDRDQVLLSLGDPAESGEKWFEFTDVIGYFCPAEIAYIFYEKTANTTWDEAIQAQLSRVSFMLRHYCKTILQGDLSMKKGIKELEEKRVAETLNGFKQNP